MDNLITNVLVGLGVIFVVVSLVKRFILKPEVEAQEDIRNRLQNMDMWYDLKRTVVDNDLIPIEEIPTIEKTIAFRVKTQLNKGVPKDPRDLVEIYYACMFSVCATACGKTDKEFMSMMDELDRQGLAQDNERKTAMWFEV
jgi:hypothetical protein